MSRSKNDQFGPESRRNVTRFSIDPRRKTEIRAYTEPGWQVGGYGGSEAEES